jgi:protein-disulfide isomerase
MVANMSTNPQPPTKHQRREAARAARLEAEQAEAAASRRRKRLTLLLAVLGAAAVVVVVAIVVSSGGGSGAKNRPAAAQKASGAGAIPGQKESAEMLAGIPQQNIYLGKPNAPVRLVEFADLQCPFCREYSLQTLPTLVQDYVRTGKVRMEFRNLSFIGDDSVTAGRAAAAAGQQDKLWNFIDVFYFNQGEENTGYVTNDFLTTINKAAGVNDAQAKAFMASPDALKPLETANNLADQNGVQSTPTILIGKRGGALKKVDASPTDVNAFKSAIDGVLGQA